MSLYDACREARFWSVRDLRASRDCAFNAGVEREASAGDVRMPDAGADRVPRRAAESTDDTRGRDLLCVTLAVDVEGVVMRLRVEGVGEGGVGPEGGGVRGRPD